jgi:hypothetical protein
MTSKRLIKAGILLGLGLNLASCGGFVADHWPHWAGGLPDDVPPRPGAPGYSEFVAHGQANQGQANQGQANPGQANPTVNPEQASQQDAARSQQPAAVAASTGARQLPAVLHPAASAAPVSAAVPQDNHDSSPLNGGLY